MERTFNCQRFFFCWFIAFIWFGLAGAALAQEKEGSEKSPVTRASPTPGQEVDQLEEDLNQLKEEVFRSKARTSLLQEFLTNTYVEIFFRNDAQRDYELVSALYILDNAEVFRKEFSDAERAVKQKEEKLIFSGTATPGRHEISVVLVFRGKKSGGYTDKDYEHQVREDFSFVAGRGEVTSVTVTAEDLGYISKDLDRTPSHYKILLDFKIETQRLANIRKKLRRRSIGLQLEGGILIDSYQVVSDRLNIPQQNSLAFPIGARAEWWFLPNWGIEGYYTFAMWSAGSGMGSQDLDVMLNWMGLDGKFRYQFGRSIYNPEIILRTGYNIMNFGVDNNPLPNMVRSSDYYKYVDVGIGTKVPITWNFGFQGNFYYMPWMDLDESPLGSGFDAKNLGFAGDAGFYYNFWDNLSVILQYRLFYVNNDFIGRGTRTSLNGLQLNLVETQIILHGGTVGLKYEF